MIMCLDWEWVNIFFCIFFFLSGTVRYSFKQHMRTHDMDKCFKCDQCDFIANTERSLDQHAAIHNQGKKYECNLCHMTFNLQQSLEKHSLSCSLDPGYITELKEKRVR